MFERVQKEAEILDRHVTIFKLISDKEPVGIVHLMNRSNYPLPKIRYSLQLLEEQGLIAETTKGYATEEDIEYVVRSEIERLESIKHRLDYLPRLDGDALQSGEREPLDPETELQKESLR